MIHKTSQEERVRAIRLAHAAKEHAERGTQPIPWSAAEQNLMGNLVLELMNERDNPPYREPELYPRFPEEHVLAHLNILPELLRSDLDNVHAAEQSYQASWKRRGGVGAFMMMARKWDRLEPRVAKYGYDIFTAIAHDKRREGAIDDVRDLRRYLALVECEVLRLNYITLETSTKDTES